MQGIKITEATTHGDLAAGPIDADHLARQTGGDEALGREVMELFASQLRELAASLPDLEMGAIAAAMHRLKGGARALGAFELAACAAALETAPADAARHARLHAGIKEVLRAIDKNGPGL